eukprot:15453996-Alexandrium_andersonii.AAC.1
MMRPRGRGARGARKARGLRCNAPRGTACLRSTPRQRSLRASGSQGHPGGGCVVARSRRDTQEP